MSPTVAIVGAGVSGLTCGIVFVERGWQTEIFAEEIGTASAAAAAIWYPYDTGPLALTIRWALETYRTLQQIESGADSGVSTLELRKFSRTGEIEIPDWAIPLGAARIRSRMPVDFV